MVIKMKEFIINENDGGQRVDKFVTKAVPLLPKSLLCKYIRLKRIKLNGKKCDISTKLTVGDVMQLYINDEFFEEKRAGMEFLAAPATISIVYEDENILIMDKPVGLVVHEDESGSADTLINRVLHYLYNKGEYKPDEEASFVPSLCNRIDRNTQGMVIAAKNAQSLRIMNAKIKNRELHKKYLCVTIGSPKSISAELKAYLFKDEKNNKVFVSDTSKAGYKTIITRYKVLEKRGELALCEVELITGRTHQIRAHMAHIGCPLLGDGKYGYGETNRSYNEKYQALCSYYLEFDFTSDSEILEYLNKKCFVIKDVWFRKKYFN